MIKPLTSLRFIAALFVFGHHLHFYKQLEEVKPIYDVLFAHGYLGVPFFFILSGFILTYSYYEKFKDGLKLVFIKDFYVARLARIYPLHLLTLLLTVPLFFTLIQDQLRLYTKLFFINASLFQGLFPDSKIFLSFNAPAWSLSAELFFYLVFPFVFLIFNKLLSNVKTILLTYVVFVVVGFSIGFAFKNVLGTGWLFYYFPGMRMFDFFAGMLLGFLWKKVTFDSLCFKKWTGYEILSVGLFLITIYLSRFAPATITWGIMYIPSISFVVWVFSFQRGFLSKVLSNKLLIFAGEISFSFYMLHWLILRYTEKTQLNLEYPILYSLAVLFLTLALSALTYKYFEVPTMKRVKKVFATKKRVAAGESTKIA